MLTKNEIDELLESIESRSLDFKEMQYTFAGCKDEIIKSKLLKDIVAFANTTRMHDAFILIGAREVKGKKAIATGITDHIDDHSLQQFVNSKTNRPVAFAYEATPYEGISLGVIRIDKDQSRPITVLKKYGDCSPDDVLIRRGSSTAKATPDEIYQMASATIESQSRRTADLGIFFFDAKAESKSKQLEQKRTSFFIDGAIPEYGSNSNLMLAVPRMENKKFYGDCAQFLREKALAVQGVFGIANSGDGSANDIVVKLRFISDSEFVVLCEDDAQPKPNTSILGSMRTIHDPKPQVAIERSSLGWHATFALKKLVAKDEHIFRDSLFVIAPETCAIDIEVSIYSDELSSPIKQSLQISVEVENRTITLEEFFKFADRYDR